MISIILRLGFKKKIQIYTRINGLHIIDRIVNNHSLSYRVFSQNKKPPNSLFGGFYHGK